MTKPMQMHKAKQLGMYEYYMIDSCSSGDDGHEADETIKYGMRYLVYMLMNIHNKSESPHYNSYTCFLRWHTFCLFFSYDTTLLALR